MQKKWFIIACLLLLLPAMSVSANEVESGEECIIAADRIVNGPLFAFCEELYVYGVVEGDIIGASILTVIDGTVTGNIYMVGGQLDIRANVDADIHYGGAVLRLNPVEEVEEGSELPQIPFISTRSIKALTLSTTIYSQTVIERGILNAGYQLIIHGDIQDDVGFGGSTLIVNGAVDGEVDAIVGDPQAESDQIEALLYLLPFDLDIQLIDPGLTIGEGAEISGDVLYTGPVEGRINGQVNGALQYTAPQPTVPPAFETNFLQLYFEALGSEFATLLIIGVLVVFFANNFLEAPVANLRTRPFASLGVGLLGFLLSFPIILIFVVLCLALLGFLFIIGFRGVVLAIGLVLGLLNVGGASIFYFVAIFVTRAIVGLAIGRLILRVIFKRNDVDDYRRLQYLALAIGVFIIAATSSLPLIGVFINATALFLGLGAILIVVLAQFERFRNTTAVTRAPNYQPSPAIIREHRYRPDMQQASVSSTHADSLNIKSDEDTYTLPPPGSDNLPEGFDWTFFED